MMILKEEIKLHCFFLFEALYRIKMKAVFTLRLSDSASLRETSV